MSTDSGFWFGQGEVFYSGVATQSCRFDDGSGAYLERDPSSAGNQKMWTTSMWCKRTEIGGNHYLFTSYGPANNDGIAALYFQADQIFTYYDTPSATPYGAVGSAYFRDPNAWYHIVWAVDAANTIHKVWVNNVLISTDTNMYPPDYSYNMNNTEIHRIGEAAWGLGSYDMDGYLSHFVHIDGQYLEPDSFAEYKDGVWIPKDTSGLTFGTNGFQLDFKGTGTSTSSGVVSSPTNIGDDSSGNNHHWTPVNLSTDDSNCPDCPENNFCTMNPLDKGTNSTAMSISEGNLKIKHNSTGAWQGHRGAFAVSSGKWYYEVQIATRPTHTTQNYAIGFFNTDTYNAMYAGLAGNLSFGMNSNTATTYKDSASTGYGTAADADAETYMVALDADNGKIWFGLEGTWMASGDPAGDSNPSISSAGSHTWSPICSSYAYGTPYGVFVYNFGQEGTFLGTKTAGNNADDNGYGNFLYDVPAGFLALCSANLPKPTIGPEASTQHDDHFNSVLWDGNASTQSITGVGFQPDLAWIKGRNVNGNHMFTDSLRGVTKELTMSTGAYAETTNTDGLTAFGVDGFSLGSNYHYNGSYKYVGYNWKAGGAPTATNSAGEGATPTSGSVKIDGSDLGSALAGDIPATKLSANTTSGFSIITYTGNGTSGETIAHGLGAVPEVLIIKKLDATAHYGVMYHSHLGPTYETYIPLTQAPTTSNFWASTTPTTTTFTVSDSSYVNASSKTYVCYAFAEVEGFSKMGSYVGNGSTDGPFIYTGFKPAWIWIRATGISNQYIYDSARATFNPTGGISASAGSPSAGYFLFESYAHEAGNGIDFLSNGFKIRNADNSPNQSGVTIMYMVLGEENFKYANAR